MVADLSGQKIFALGLVIMCFVCFLLVSGAPYKYSYLVITKVV